MQTFPVFFHDWQALAYRANGKWHLVPRHLTDHLALNWPSQYRKIMTTDLREGVVMMTTPSGGGAQETLTLTLPFFGAFVLMVTTDRVPEAKRPLVIEMKRSMLDAIERQLGQMLNLPGMMEAEDFEKLPLPPYVLSMMSPEEVRATSSTFAATRLMRVGLAASRTAPLVNWSVYRARQHQKLCRRIGLVPLMPSQQRMLDQPSLFGEG
jgi:hypothetical protein